MNIKELAKKVNLSVTTTSRALNNHSSVAPKTIALVKSAAKQYGYAPSSSARSLKNGKTNVIGLTFSLLEGSDVPVFLSEFILNLANVLDSYDYSLMVSTYDNMNETNAWQKMVLNKQVDAMILPRLQENDERISWLTKRNFPFVAFGHPNSDMNFPWLDLDNHQAFFDGVHHLYKQGHRDIAMLAGDSRYVLTQQRIAGYKKAMSELGLVVLPHHISHHQMNENGGKEGFNMLYAQEKMPTAIMCANDSQAIGAIGCAYDYGLIAGQDIAVIGYDDLSYSENLRPKLTSFHQPTKAIAKRLAQMTISYLNGTDYKSLQELWRARLVIRDSCRLKQSIM